ncbi:MAG: hypothetical protein SV377_07560 [Halobacteria archaeon]|nr:hypothetical protein [Halobacteria archaeon]
MAQNQTKSSIGIELPYNSKYVRDTLLLVLYLAFNVALLLSIGAATVYVSEVLVPGVTGAMVFVWAFGVTVAVVSFSIVRRRLSHMVESVKVRSDARSTKNHKTY